MSVFFSFLQGVFSAVQPAPAAAGRENDWQTGRPRSEMARGVGPFSRVVHKYELTRGDVFEYRTAADLWRQWRALDSAEQTGGLTVVLVLNRSIRGNLRELIDRNYVADQLIIVPEAGYWPGTDSLGDLSLSARRCGWGSIWGCRDLAEAIAETATERLLVIVPAGFSIATVAAHTDLSGRLM